MSPRNGSEAAMKIKLRISIWLIVIAMGIPMSLAAVVGEWQVALSLAAILGTLASKLVESDEKGQ